MPQDRRQRARRGRLVVGTASLLAHLSIAFALVSLQPSPPQPLELAPISVELVTPPPVLKPPEPPAPPEPTPEPPAPAPPTPEKPKPVKEKPPPPRLKVRAAKAPPPDVIDSILANVGPTSTEKEGFAQLSDSEVAGAARAGAGQSGGECDMARRLQAALRKDSRVRAAVAGAQMNKAILVWNGDWVRHPGQEGNGLAVVREVMMWEIGFAPQACRAERVRGLVLFTLNDGPGAPRLVVGQGSWRWSDLLLLHRAAG